MADFDTQINVGMNVDGVVSGTEKAKRSVRDLGESARGAGKSLGGIGDGAGQSAQKVESATKSMIQSIQRTTAATEAGDKSTRAYQESLARLRGIDVAALRPYLDQLDQAKVKAQAAAKANETLGASMNALKVGALAVVAAGAAFGAYAKKVNDGVDALNDLKDATGASIENISALEDIAKRTGTSFDTVGTSLIKLNQALNTAKPGSDAEKAIKAIGLSVSDLKRLDPAEAFQKIAVSLSGFSDDANKARLTQELFGKSLKEVAPLLKDVADAGGLVAKVTTQQAEEAEKFNKQIFALQANALGASRTIVSEFLPSLNAIGQEFLSAADGTGSLAQSLGGGLKSALEAFAIVGANVAFVLKGVGREIGAIAAQTVALATLDIDGFNAISEAVKEDGERARKELDALERRILGAGQKFNPNNESAAEAARLARGTARASIGSLPDTAADKAAASAYNAELKKQADLLNTLTGVNADYQESLTRLQAIKASGRISDEKYVELVKQLIEKQPMVVEQRKQEEEALKAASKAQDAYVKEQLKGIEAAEKSAKSAGDTLQKYLDEEQALTLAAAKNISLAQAIAEVELARLREAQTAAIASKANDGVLLALDEEIKKREQIVKAIGRKENREAATNAAKEALAEWKKAAEQIEQSITDALFRGFESGKGFIENLRDTIVNTFKTMVLRPIISAVVNPVAGAAASALGFSGAANAGSAASGVGSLASAGGLLGTFGSSLSAGFTGTLTAGFTGLGATLSGGLSAIATGQAATMAAGFGQIAGALGPLGLAAVGIAGLFGAFKGDYVKSLGESVATVTADKLVKLSGSGGNNDVSIGGGLDIRQTATSDAFVNNLATAFVTASAKLGISTSGASFGFGSNNSDGGKFGLTASVGGQTYKTGDIKTSEAALQLEASRAVFFALQSSELPGYLSKVFNGITASTAAQADIDAALNYAAGLKTIRDALTETRTPLQVLQDSVSSAFTALGTSADTFKTDFVSAIDAGISPDKLAQFQLLGANLEALAQSSGTAAGAVRSLTDIANERKTLDERFAQATLTDQQLIERTRNALDESNRARFDEVLAVEKTKAALIDSASEMSRVAGIVSSQQTQLLNAAGLPVSASGSRDGQAIASGSSSRVQIPKTIAELNASLDAFGGRAYQNADAAGVSEYAKSLGLTAQIFQSTLDKLAADDRAAQAAFSSDGTKGDDNARYAAMATGGAADTSARDAADTSARDAADTSARDAANALATERKALQDQLDDLQFSTAEKAAKARAAISEENRALFDQLEQVRATKTAAEEAAQALEKFAGAMRSLTDTNADLQIKLLEAQGNTTGAQAAARARDIAKLTEGFSGDEAAKLTAQYDANESLKAQIEALTKSQQDAASAASALKSAWASVTDSLLDQVDRIRGKLAADSLDSIGAQQARFTIATAQARAGDLEAAKRLGSYGDALIGSVTADATNRLERIKIQAQVAESLQTTASLLGGTSTPVLSAQFPQQQSTVQLEQNIASLTAQVALLKGHLAEIQTQAKRTADAVNGAGEAPMVVEVD